MAQVPTRFGAELKRLRTGLGLTQKQLGEKLGMKQANVAALETVKSDVNASTLFRLCSALGVKCQHFEPFLATSDEQVETNPQPEEQTKPAAKPRGRPKKGD